MTRVATTTQDDEGTPAPAPDPVARSERLRAGLRTPLGRGLVVALGVHVAIRLLNVGQLALAAPRGNFALSDRLAAWDGGWFLRLAAEGYPDHLDLSNPEIDQTTGGLAFFPVYPGLIRAVATVTRMPDLTTGVVLSVLAAAAAAAGVYVLGARLASPRVGVYAVAVWSALPMAIVLSMVYTEALFTALAVWAVVLAMRDRWLWAGTLGLLAGLTRATGLALGIALVAGAVLTRMRGERRIDAKVVVGCLLALAGTPLWWLSVWVITGRADGWFAVQDAFWGSHFDFGLSVFQTTRDALLFRLPFAGQELMIDSLTVLFLLGAVVLAVDLVIRAVRRPDWILPAAYAVAALALTIGGAGYVFSKTRFLVAIFPLVLPIAVALARARTAVAVCFLIAITVAGSWFSVYMLVVWRSAI